MGAFTTGSQKSWKFNNWLLRAGGHWYRILTWLKNLLGSNTLRESESEVVQLCPTLYDPMNCSQPGSSVHGIFQARVLEWGAISFSRRSSQPRDWTQVSHIVGRCFTVWVTREVLHIKIFFTQLMHQWTVDYKLTNPLGYHFAIFSWE